MLSLQKNSLKPNAASHNNVSWYPDTDGLIEHSPGGGSLYYKELALQKVIPGFGVYSLVYHEPFEVQMKTYISLFSIDGRFLCKVCPEGIQPCNMKNRAIY